MFVYQLQIPDTGKVVLQEETDRSMKGWHGIAVRKALRYRRTPEAIKKELREGNSIVGWANSDELQAVLSPEEFEKIVARAYRGMDKKSV